MHRLMRVDPAGIVIGHWLGHGAIGGLAVSGRGSGDVIGVGVLGRYVSRVSACGRPGCWADVRWGFEVMELLTG